MRLLDNINTTMPDVKLTDEVYRSGLMENKIEFCLISIIPFGDPFVDWD